MVVPEVQMRLLRACLLLVLLSSLTNADEPKSALKVGAAFVAKDSISCADETSDDARECLANLAWKPESFTVRLEPAVAGCGDFLVRFPSPRPIGNATVDQAAMEWFAAKDADGNITKAPAIVVIHESGRQMTIGRMIARDLGGHGLHAFLLQLPGYGARRDEGLSKPERALPALRQAIGDARRARDAVAALPLVDRSKIGLQGTSLGGFVTATTAGLDHGYDCVFIFLAGGDLERVVLSGNKDAAKLRKKLTDAGVTEEQIKEHAREVEPLRLAHRMNPANTWLYTGKYDDVVPPQCSHALAEAAHLTDGHHVEMPVDHYSGAIYLPKIMAEIVEQMKPSADQKAANASSKASSILQSVESNESSSPEPSAAAE